MFLDKCDRDARSAHHILAVLPIYELDFGFGKPWFGRRKNPAAVAGSAAVSPTPECDGAVVVTVLLHPEEANALSALLKLRPWVCGNMC